MTEPGASDARKRTENATEDARQANPDVEEALGADVEEATGVDVSGRPAAGSDRSDDLPGSSAPMP